MADAFGLDFGTTNTLASIIQGGCALSLTNREDNLPHPSVVWYHGGEVVVGRHAKQHLTQIGTGVLGDVVRSPKSFLGTGASIHVAGIAREPAEVVAEILRFVRQDAMDRGYTGMSFDRAVLTIPVGMNGLARRELRDAALRQGLHIQQFVHEPLAALYGYLRGQSEFRRRVAELEGQLALVFDWGGGTLDLTLCRFIGGNLVQVQNRGDNNVGGDRFDERLLRYVKDTHARQHNITAWPGEMPNADAKLIAECEAAKIALSDRRDYRIFVANYLRSDGPERVLEVVLSRETLIELTKDLVLQGVANIDSLLDAVGIKDTSIALCLPTGGMVKMPYIRERILERFGPARAPNITNGDRIIAEGAAWIANDGLRLRLAKPFEVLHADNTYVTIFDERTVLPLENQIIASKLGAYCVDPRDGFAKFQLVRPRMARKKNRHRSQAHIQQLDRRR